jgi:hypothetical protein
MGNKESNTGSRERRVLARQGFKLNERCCTYGNVKADAPLRLASQIICTSGTVDDSQSHSIPTFPTTSARTLKSHKIDYEARIQAAIGNLES